MKFVNIYWPFSENGGERTMSPRVTRTLRLEQLKMTKIMFMMKVEVMTVSQSEEEYPM